MELPGGTERGQAIQIGAVILFAFLVIAFSGYQAFVVPDQNRAVEFNHFEEVKDDMESARNAVIDAGEASNRVPAEVQLGTRYPARQFAVQPPGSSGSLRSTPIGGSGNEAELTGTAASLTDICGVSSVRAQRLVYQPTYNYLQGIENVTYENTLTYTNGRAGGTTFQTTQQLVDGSRISLYPFNGTVNETGTGLASVTLSGGVTGSNDSVPGGFGLVLPTKLSASEWRQLLSDEANVDDVIPVTGRDAVEIQFSGGVDYNITCVPVGADGAPNNSPTVTGGGGGSGGSINPNFGADVVLTQVDETGADNSITITLNNTAGNVRNISALRFPFFNANAQSASNVVNPGSLTYDGVSINRVGRVETVPTLRIDPGREETLTLDFNCGTDGTGSGYDLASGDFFVLTVFFEDGSQDDYFVSLSNSGGTNNRC